MKSQTVNLTLLAQLVSLTYFSFNHARCIDQGSVHLLYRKIGPSRLYVSLLHVLAHIVVVTPVLVVKHSVPVGVAVHLVIVVCADFVVVALSVTMA